MVPIFFITIKETLRKRIVFVGILLTGIFLFLFALGVHYGYQDILRHPNLDMLKKVVPLQFLSLGLFFASFTVSGISILAAVGSISGEIENGTMSAIISRPVRRSEIILGKFSGYGLLLALLATVLYTAVVVIVRCYTGLIVPITIGTVGLFCLQPLVLLAVTMFGTTFLSTLANGIVVFMLYAVGVVGGMLEQFGHLFHSEVLIKTGIVSSLVIPADAVYRKIVYVLMSTQGFSLSAILGPLGSASQPSVWMLVYTGFYILGFLLLAVWKFSKRDL